MVVLPKNSRFGRGVGGGRKSWTVSTLTAQWAQHASIVAADPNDLERHYACGLALQMAGGGDESNEEYLKFCVKAEKYHVTVDEAVRYYDGIAEGMAKR